MSPTSLLPSQQVWRLHGLPVSLQHLMSHTSLIPSQQVWRLHGLRDSVQRLMTHTQDRGNHLDVWSRGRDWVDVVVTEAHNFSEVLKIFHLEHSVVIKDLDR